MNRKIGIFIILLLFIAGCGQAKEGKEINMYKQITMAEAKEIMSTEEEFIILDVRTQEEYADGHIPGAICVPNETIGTEPPVELPDKEKKILVYCRSGNRSRQAAAKLAAMGYSNIVEFGGIMDWNGEIEK
jgi:rhodanese-related sulfurtransferase